MCNLKQVICFGVIVLATHAGLASGETLRDPTQPLGHMQVSHSTGQKPLRLQSVLVGGERKLAYINGQQVREQDVLIGSNGIRVVRIEAGSVTLQQGERRWQLELNKVSIRH